MARTIIGSVAIATLFVATLIAQTIPPGALSPNKPVFFEGAQVATTGAGGDLALALDPSKDYVVLHQECSRYEVVLADDERVKECERDSQSRNEQGCRRCEIAGWLFGGRWRPASAPVDGLASSADGFRVGVYGFGSGKWTRIANADSAVGIIDDRFSAGTPPYNQPRQIEVDEKGSGGGWGGGVDFVWHPNFGARVGIAVESERSSPTQVVSGNRDLGGLRFEQQGSSLLRSVAFMAGPTLRFPGGFVVTGGPTWTRWSVDLTQTGSLRIACPNPCQTVISDNVTEEVNGTDIGYHIGAEYYPGDSWLGLYLLYARTTYKDVYDPSRALAWPRDWQDQNLFIGASIRTPNLRGNRR